MSKHNKLDLSKVKTIKSSERDTKSEISHFGSAIEADVSISEFLKSLPSFLKAEDLLALAYLVAKAKIEGKNLIWMMGAHPIKVGLSTIITDLIENGFITHLAVNGAFIIHDLEIAYSGRTSEEVSDGLADGTFGMIDETPRLLFEAADLAKDNKLGLGEGVGRFIEEQRPQYAQYSILRKCYSADIPVTVHIAIGTDTISQHPGFDAGLFGRLSGEDFLIMAESVSRLSGGIIINFGSAVILPEVFLKALTAARNVKGKIGNFTAANFDMIQHYRPNQNVVTRPVIGSGKGYSFTGHHEIMMPLLAAALKHKYIELSERS